MSTLPISPNDLIRAPFSPANILRVPVTPFALNRDVFTPPSNDHPIMRLANTSQGIRLPSRAKSPGVDKATWARARVVTNSGLA